MGFLKSFFNNVFHEQGRPAVTTELSSFQQLSRAQLEAHLRVRRYGDFTLTEAVRPSFDLKVLPRQGYRHDTYRDPDGGPVLPVLMAAASNEKLFELFVDLLEPLGNVVDVVLETSHARHGHGHDDLMREHVDLPVLLSVIWEFEDLLTNDGCTGIAVLNPRLPQEVQFDEHKLLIVYGSDLSDYEQILQRHGIVRDEALHFITEAEHVHSSSDDYHRQFEQLKLRLGMDSLD